MTRTKFSETHSDPNPELLVRP